MQPKHIITIELSIASLTQRICCDSAWYCTSRPELPVVTPDYNSSTTRFIGHAFHSLLAMLAGWVKHSEINTTLPSANFIMTLALRHKPDHAMAQALQSAADEAVVAHVLGSYYPGTGTLHQAAWRKHTAQLLLLLSRDAMLDACGA